jgi:hypothetical protein
MDWRHILFMLFLVAVGYWLGGKWPGLLGKVPVIGGAISP